MEKFDLLEFCKNIPFTKIGAFIIIGILIFFGSMPPKYNLFGKSQESKQERVYNKKLSRKIGYRISGRFIMAFISFLFLLISLLIGLYFSNKT